MAAITSKLTGPWSQGITWAGNVAPGNGDTAIIAAGNVVTVTTDVIIGTSDVAGTPAVTLAGLTSQVVIASGKKLTIRGDFLVKSGFGSGAPQLLLNAGSTLEFDSSLAASPATTKYAMTPDGNFSWGFFQANGSSGSRCTVQSNASGANGHFTIGSFVDGCTIVAGYTDFVRIGDAAVPAVNLQYVGGFPVIWDVQHCSFTSCGLILTNSVPADGILRHIGNQHIGTIGGLPAFFTSQTVLTSGVRQVRLNTFDGIYGSDGSVSSFPQDMTIEDNLFYTAPHFAGTAVWASFSRNYVRSDGVDIVVIEGDATDCYFTIDTFTMTHSHQPDIGLAPTSVAVTGCVFDNTYFLSDPISVVDGILENLAADHLTSLVVNHNIVVPTGDGIYGSQSLMEMWGPHHTLYDIQHNTINCPRGAGSVQMEYEDADVPNGVASRGTLKNNLFWARTALSTNFAANLDIENPITDFFAPSSVSNNSRFNCANTNASAPHSPANQGNSYIGAWSVTPGAQDIIGDPAFVDKTRNLATFDTAYLQHVAGSTWASHAGTDTFVIGNIVSDHNSSYYENAVINYRCITSHTKNTANSEPGVGSAWHTYWEFASYESIRNAIFAGTLVTDSTIGAVAANYIVALTKWVRSGFSPTNQNLKAAASDGTDIGAVAVSTPSPSSTAALHHFGYGYREP